MVSGLWGMISEKTLQTAENISRVLTLEGVPHIVNFLNPLCPGAGELMLDALSSVTGDLLQSIDLVHLIALKIYAGGPLSRADIEGLFRANPDLDLSRIRELCDTFGILDDYNRMMQ